MHSRRMRAASSSSRRGVSTRHPPSRHPPRSRHPPAGTPWAKSPQSRQPPPPGAGTLQGAGSPQSMHPPGAGTPRGRTHTYKQLPCPKLGLRAVIIDPPDACSCLRSMHVCFRLNFSFLKQ